MISAPGMLHTRATEIDWRLFRQCWLSRTVNHLVFQTCFKKIDAHECSAGRWLLPSQPSPAAMCENIAPACIRQTRRVISRKNNKNFCPDFQLIHARQ